MFEKNDFYSILHNPDDYEKRKEYDRKKKLFYGNQLRIQIEENNKIKSKINGTMENLELPLISHNNNYFPRNEEISKDNNDYNNYNLFNIKYNQKMMNYHYTENLNNNRNQLIYNLPNIPNQIDINNYNNINNNEYILNKNDINVEKIFNDFIEFQINIISNYIHIIDKLNNNMSQISNTNDNNSLESKKRKDTDSPNKTFKEKNSFNNLTFDNNTNDTNTNSNLSPKKNDIYLLRLSIEKEKKKALDFINKEKEKIIKELGYIPDDDYNNKIEELFNKITNKTIIKYSSISIPNNSTLNSGNNNKTIEQNENETNNINNTSSDNTSKNDSKLIFTKSNNYTSDNNTYNNKDTKNLSNNTIKNMNVKSETKIDDEKNNNDEKEKGSPKKNYIFAFKNNSFNIHNNSEMSKSLSKKDKNKDSKSNNNENKNNDTITFDEEEEEKEEKDEKEEEESISVSEKVKDENKNTKKNISNKISKKKTTYILSQKNNIMDIFSKNEKKRMKKFSVNFNYKKINDFFYDERKKTKTQKFLKKNTRQIFSFPTNQNFKNIKNITNDIKPKNSKTKFNNVKSQKIVPFFRMRSRSYKGKKVNNNLRKKIEEHNDYISDNNSKEIIKRENSKNFSYSYKGGSNNKENNSKINKRKNKRYYTGHFNYKNRKKKLSIPEKSNEGISGGLSNTEINNFLIAKNKTKMIEKKPNFFKKKSNSLGNKDDKNTLEEKIKENFTNKFFNKRAGSSFLRSINNENNQTLSNNNLNLNNEIYGNDDKLYKMIKNFENNVKERIKYDENKKISNNKINNVQLNNYQMNNFPLNNNMNIKMNVNNNILVKNNFKNMNEVELIPKKYIFRCKKVIYPEIEAEKLIEKERLLFGRNKYN